VASLVALVTGATVGALLNGFPGGVIGAVLGLVVLQLLQLKRGLADLSRSLEAADDRWRVAAAALEKKLKTRPAGQAPDAAPPPAPSVASVPDDAAAVVAPVGQRVEAVPAAAPSDEPPLAPPVLAPPALRTREPIVPEAPPAEVDRDPSPLVVLGRRLLGGNTIAKVGIGILFIGLGFVAKLASQHVSLEVGLISVGGAALVLLGFGWRLRVRRRGYAQILQGGAVAVLYLTLFVAFRLLPFGQANVGLVFGLMVAVAVLAAALSVLQDAPALAVIGALGGFASPLLVSSGSGNYVALFSYYLLLDLGIAAVAWHKTWRALNLVGFVFTFVVGTAWGVLEYEATRYASSQAFLAAFFLVFVAIMLMPARHLRTGTPGGRAGAWVNGSLLFGLPTITFALQYGLVQHTAYGVALSALVLAGFYVLLAAWLMARPFVAAVVFEGSLAIGTVFGTLTIPFALDARSTAGAWALEGAALVWLGFRQGRALGRVFGYLLLVLAGGWLFVASIFQHLTAVFNATLLNGLLLAGASLAGAWCVQRFSGETPAPRLAGGDLERAAEPVLIGWGTAWLAYVALIEIDRFVEPAYGLAAVLVCASAVALAYVGLSVLLGWRRVAMPAIGFAPLLLMAVASWPGNSPSQFSSPASGGGWWAWPLALVVHLIVLHRAAPGWPSLARGVSHLLGVLVLAALGALQGRAITAGWGDATSAWAWLGWLAVPAALLLVLPHPATARAWPVKAAVWAYQTAAGAVLVSGLLVWALLANVASDGSAAPLPHVPLLNPLDLGVGIALLAAWRWRASDGGPASTGPFGGFVLAAIAADAFVWLNAILIRAFHHWTGVPFHLAAWMNSLAVQTGISLLWTAIALVLMWTAARRAVRAPWVAGAVLLAAVVVKLMLVDLSASGTVTRIVSFIGVGVLMLVIGYVAPPPRWEGHHDAS